MVKFATKSKIDTKLLDFNEDKYICKHRRYSKAKSFSKP